MRMSNAWACCDYEENILEVVFADTKDKAKSYFRNLEKTYYPDCKLEPFRARSLDHLDYPDGYFMDWNKVEDLMAILQGLGLWCIGSEIKNHTKRAVQKNGAASIRKSRRYG